jgi:hypothetical protein
MGGRWYLNGALNCKWLLAGIELFTHRTEPLTVCWR